MIVFHKLKPLKEAKEKVCGDARICLVDKRNFLEGMKHEHMCYALIPRADRECDKEIPIEIFYLLSQFQNIMSDNVPKGFLLMRNISQQMDLILELVFQIR